MTGFLILTPPLNVYEQMAIDEELALSARSGKDVYLRFFNWNNARAVTFGYAQFAVSVKKQIASAGFAEAPFTRRPTGGGVVFHDGDVTFSIVFPPFAGSLKEIYHFLHSAVNRELARENIKLNVLDGSQNKDVYLPNSGSKAGECFVNPVESDILDETGSKVLGGALRKMGNVYLYQGSLQLPAARGNKDIEAAVKRAMSAVFGVEWKETAPADIFMKRVKKQAARVYQSQAWIEKF